MTWEQAVVGLWFVVFTILQGVGVFAQYDTDKRWSFPVVVGAIATTSTVLIAGVLHRGGFW